MHQFIRKSYSSRRTLLWPVIAALMLCSFDIPTPVTVEKDLSIAYPCQSRACGCKNADQCWSSCCCFSDAEKLAWARANGVTPPKWFQEKLDGSPKLAAKPKSGCCCCCKTQSTARPVVSELVTHESTERPDRVEVRLSFRQQKGCQGQTDYLLKHLVYLPLPVSSDVSLEEFPLFASPFPSFPTVVLDLPTPPPRVCFHR